MFSEYSMFLAKHKVTPSTSSRLTTQATASATIQINAYMEESLVPFETLKNPIDYWLNHRDCELKEVALKYMVPCATSVPSERLGSAAGNTSTNRRSCLNATHTNELVVINKNSYLLDN